MDKEENQLTIEGKKALMNGDNELAILNFTDAIELTPKNMQLYILRSTAYAKIGNYEEGLKDAQMVIEINPFNFRGHLLCATCHYHLDHLDEAMESYSKALQSKPTKQIMEFIARAISKVRDKKRR
jgi:stress-induced-phosphoprotein 1